jgi:hypothetical protein
MLTFSTSSCIVCIMQMKSHENIYNIIFTEPQKRHGYAINVLNTFTEDQAYRDLIV